MKKISIGAFLVCAFFMLAFRPLPVGYGDYAPTIKKQLDEMSAALLKKDFATYVKYTHPKIISEMGGEKAMADSMARYFSEMEHRGVTIANIRDGDPSWVIDTAGELQCTVPVSTAMQVQGGFVYMEATFVGVSKDRGLHWVFIDTTDDYRTIRKEFPSLSSKLNIPVPDQPVFRKN